MTDITKNTIGVTPDSFSGQVAPVIPSCVAGEALGYATPVFLDTDGEVYMSVSTKTLDRVVTETVDSDAGVVTLKESKCIGFTPKSYFVGAKNVAIYGKGTIFPDYGTGLTAGTYLFVSGTAGVLSDVALAAGDRPVALVISATDIVVL